MHIKSYYCYILTNVAKSVLYVGVTNELERRLEEHKYNAQTKTGFTGKYNVTNLIYFEEFDNPSDAIAREKMIKGWTRKKKEMLIATLNPEWNFLDVSTE